MGLNKLELALRCLIDVRDGTNRARARAGRTSDYHCPHNQVGRPQGWVVPAVEGVLASATYPQASRHLRLERSSSSSLATAKPEASCRNSLCTISSPPLIPHRETRRQGIKMKSFFTLFSLLFAAAVHAISATGGERLLVLLDDVEEKEQYSTFLGDLESMCHLHSR